VEHLQKEYLIYFHENPDPTKVSWWIKLLCRKKKFRHVGALGYNPYHDMWYSLQYTHEGIIHQFVTKDELYNILAYFRINDYKVLNVPVKKEWKLIWIKEHSCVSFIMRLIGYHSWFVFTPYQLYCALKKKGIKSFWEK